MPKRVGAFGARSIFYSQEKKMRKLIVSIISIIIAFTPSFLPLLQELEELRGIMYYMIALIFALLWLLGDRWMTALSADSYCKTVKTIGDSMQFADNETKAKLGKILEKSAEILVEFQNKNLGVQQKPKKHTS